MRQSDTRQDQTPRYAALCARYRIEPTRNNSVVAPENGSIERPQGHLKQAIEDALLLRGSRDCDDLLAYRRFIDEAVGHRNARNRMRLDFERSALQSLPQRYLDQRLHPQEGILFGAVRLATGCACSWEASSGRPKAGSGAGR